MAVRTTRARVSTGQIVAPGQIGWVYFQEGDVEIAAKVVRGKDGFPFIAFPSIRRGDTTVSVVSYLNRAIWNEKRRELLRIFREQVGEEYYRQFEAPIPLWQQSVRRDLP